MNIYTNTKTQVMQHIVAFYQNIKITFCKNYFSAICFAFSILNSSTMLAQMVPSPESNIDYLMTFGKDAKATWGDDDHVQTIFVAIPETQHEAVFIRILDPSNGSSIDQENGEFNSSTKFSVYGGAQCYTHADARNANPVGNYKSGSLLDTKTFEINEEFVGKWFTFGPINPMQGEYDKNLKSYILKLIVEGESGDDGNAYKVFASAQPQKNIAIEGCNIFSYEFSFRMNFRENKAVHFYPFIDKDVIGLKVFNFDFDNDGFLRFNSVLKKNHILKNSNDGNWETTFIKIEKEEQNTSVDLQIIKKQRNPNDMSLYLNNQYNQAVPFFSSPLGGLPRYKYKIDISVMPKK